MTRRTFLTHNAAAAAAVTMIGSPMVHARYYDHRRTIEVCCNANSIRFVGLQGPNPNDPSDLGPHPYYGASFVVQGTIYPEGTFDPADVADANANSGLESHGTPEFPDLVIGSWICRGWFIGDSDGDGSITPDDDDRFGGIFTPEGRFVATTQIYDLDPDATGRQTLVSDGIERIELGLPFRRAITGGSGRFRASRGQVTQTAVGVNATGLFNFQFDFDIRPRIPLY